MTLRITCNQRRLLSLDTFLWKEVKEKRVFTRYAFHHALSSMHSRFKLLLQECSSPVRDRNRYYNMLSETRLLETQPCKYRSYIHRYLVPRRFRCSLNDNSGHKASRYQVHSMWTRFPLILLSLEKSDCDTRTRRSTSYVRSNYDLNQFECRSTIALLFESIFLCSLLSSSTTSACQIV